MKTDNKKIGFLIAILVPAIAGVGLILFTSLNGEDENKNLTLPGDEVVNELPQNPAGDTRLNDQEQIKEALVEKNDWEAGDIELTITENDGTYASGMVGPVGGGPGGGMWFAKNVNGVWKIVWDGNGVIMCENLAEYPDFPIEMIPECYDSASDQMTDR